MSSIKRSLYIAAAALCFPTIGHAADLPGAEPVDYVKICDVKGKTGFFYIPGTETCLQIGGLVRFEMSSGETIRSATAIKESDTANRTGYRVRTRVWFDARTETEYGTLRTFVRLQLQRETGAVGAAARISSASNGLDAPDALFDFAFVQFGGLTAGQTDSFWDFKPYVTFQNPFIADRQIPLIGYTATVGDFSASVSLEDQTSHYRNDASAFRYAGQQVPDIVANLRVKQGWGEAQVSGVAHRINPKSSIGLAPGLPAGQLIGENSNSGNSTWGWGIQGGVKLNLPTANTSDQKGDFLWAQAGYIDGAGLTFVGPGDMSVGSGTIQNIVSNFQPQRDFVLVDGKTYKTRANNANLGILHYWSPQWRSGLQATYVNVNYRKVDADWRSAGVGANLIWSPVKRLDIGAEVVYMKNIKKANVNYTGSKDDDTIVGRLRVQRDF
ncbi:porin [Methylopila sp. M107]|uniref:porin n=1 Tax=Methylopila sp. M107 TaxID=1101190 RepID=UPI0003782E46|nr:porin [Methylopila sp. M107]